MAFKIARQFHHQNGEPARHKFISRAYHGNSMGHLAQRAGRTQDQIRAAGCGLLPCSSAVLLPLSVWKSKDSCGLECAAIYEEVIQWEGPETVAAVIMEPVITGGGMIVPSRVYAQGTGHLSAVWRAVHRG